MPDKFYPDIKSEPLAGAFKENAPPYWTEDAKKAGTNGYESYLVFLRIAPNSEYPVLLKNSETKQQERYSIAGLELRRNMALVAMHGLLKSEAKQNTTNTDGEKTLLLSEKTRRALNVELFDNENGPQTQEDITKGKEKIRLAYAYVEGYLDAVIKDNTPAQNASKLRSQVVKPTQQDLEESLAYIDRQGEAMLAKQGALKNALAGNTLNGFRNSGITLVSAQEQPVGNTQDTLAGMPKFAVTDAVEVQPQQNIKKVASAGGIAPKQ